MRAGLVLRTPGLPPRPKDPGGRLVKWVLLAQAPGFAYQGREYAVDADWIDARVKDYQRLTAADYTAPLLREHQRDGERHGDVLKLARFELDGRPALIAAVAFSDPAADDKIKRGMIKYLSPSFGPIEDDRGRKYDFALREASLVAAPHQKHLSPGDSHVIGAESKEADVPEDYEDKTGADDSAEMTDDTAKRLDALEAQIAKMGETMAALAELKDLMEAAMMEADKEDDAADDDSAEMAEMAALRAERDKLAEERDRAVWTQVQPASLKWTAELSEVLFTAWRADRDRVGAILSEATAAQPVAAKPVEPSPVNPWSLRLSEATPAPADDPAALTDEEIAAKAVEMAEGDQIKANKIYIQLKRAAQTRATV